MSPGTSPTPSPTTGPAALSCEGLLDDASVAAYADAGWTLSADFAQRMIEQDLPLRAFPETGGVLCQWGVGDASEYYGVTTLSPDRTASERDRLVAAGYVAGDHADGELLIGDITDGVREFNLFVGDEWTVAFSIDRIAEIRRNAAS